MISWLGVGRCFLRRNPLSKPTSHAIGRPRRRQSCLPCSCSRLKSTSSGVKSVPRLPAKYPERLLIYNAGTGRTVFIGCLKVTTIFIFGFFCLVVAPAHYYAHDKPLWMACLVLLAGIVPLAFVTTTTAPFVTYVHLRLPDFARQSRDNLLRYSRHLHRSATIDITTLSILGRPRVSRVAVGDLRPLTSPLRIANYARDAKGEEMKRSWWAAMPVKKFAIIGGRGRPREEGIWENVAYSIQRFSDGSPNKFHAKMSRQEERNLR